MYYGTSKAQEQVLELTAGPTDKVLIRLFSWLDVRSLLASANRTYSRPCSLHDEAAAVG